MPSPRRSKVRKDAQAAGYRSGYEHYVARGLESEGIPFDYESKDSVIEWEVHETRKYLPDFTLPGNVIVECKGRLTVADRKKLLAVKRQHPDIDIRLLFQADNKLNPRSKVRYTEWAKKNGFPAAVGAVPQAWIREARRACQSET